jgi:hypothetical protein
MKKNRKKNSSGFIFPAPLAVVLTLLMVLSLSYLWLCSRCEGLGVRIKKLEQKRAEIHNRVLNEEYKWSNLKSPRNIEMFLQQHNLVMAWPDESHIVRIRRDAALAATASSLPRQFAQSGESMAHD